MDYHTINFISHFLSFRLYESSEMSLYYSTQTGEMQEGSDIKVMRGLSIMDWVQLVSNYGFPIVVSLYLLVKTQQKLEEVSNLLARISESMQHVSQQHTHHVASPSKQRRTNQQP